MPVRETTHATRGASGAAALRPVAAAFCGLALIACSSGGGGPASMPVAPAPDTSSFQATWKPDTLVLSTDTVLADLTNPDAVDGVYRFVPSLTQVASLQAGQALLISGVDLVKVDSVDVQPDAIVVTTEPASLEDAAIDANVSWDVAADMSTTLRTQSLAPPLRLLSSPLLVCEAPPDGGPCVAKSTFDGMFDNLKAKQTMVLNPDGSMTMTVTLSFPQQSGSPAVLSVVMKATLKSFRHQGSIVVQGSQLAHSSFGLDGVDLDLDLNVGAVAIGTSPGLTGNTDSTLKLPVALTFPFDLGPLPAYFTLGVAIVLNSTLGPTSSAQSHVHYHVGGSFGVQASATQVTATGKLDSIDGTPPAVMNTQTVSTITAGFGVLTEVPRVTFGVGLARLASAEAYLLGKEEVVINEAINTNNLMLISGNCSTVNADVGAFAGGTLRLAGLSFKQEKEIYGVVAQLYKNGNPSVSECH